MHTVLIVEDDAVILRVASEILRDEGFTILTAGTVAEAIDFLRDGRPDLVVMDLSLGPGGEALASQLTRRGVPILVLSGAVDIDARARVLGAAGVMPKPFELDDFVAMALRLAHAPQTIDATA